MRLADLNVLDDDQAARELQRCCGSSRWARMMAAGRPFSSVAAVERAADECWQRLDTADILEAFAAHPKIGDPGRAGAAGRAAAGHPGRWAAHEQSGVRNAPDEVRKRLALGNRAYEARFGYIFIICATGKTADDMLASLEARLNHAPADELRIAAEEQRQITRLRLKKLLDGERATP
jgi:2-oxo-4-hydroxy-4-carboxy-5-ureidoimidazoline decarboxylase